MLAVFNRQQRVVDARRRISGCLDHHFNIIADEQRTRIVGERHAPNVPIGPANLAAGPLRPADIQICDGGDFDTFGRWDLRQKHGAELTCANQSHPYRLACFRPRRRQMR